MTFLFLCSCTLEKKTGSVPYLPSEIRENIFRQMTGSVHFTCQYCPRVLCTVEVRSLNSYLELSSMDRVCIHCFTKNKSMKT